MDFTKICQKVSRLEPFQYRFHIFALRGGGAKTEFPIQGADISLGGASDRLVFIKHKAKPDWSFYTADRSILKSVPLQSNPQVKQQLSKAKHKRFFNWSLFTTICALIIAAPIWFIFSMDRMSGWIAPKVPAEWEQELGESVWKQVQVQNDVLDDEAVTQRLNEFISPLIDAVESSRYQFKIHIINDSQINAFALPGGYIALNSGLILAADNSSEVLGVLAHEISHVTQQHGIRTLIGNTGIYLTAQALLGDVSGLLGAVASAAPLLLNQSYSRGFESEADDVGFELLTRARINQEGLVSFFKRLKSIEKERLAKINDEESALWIEESLALLSSHPATDDRIAAMQEKLKKNKIYLSGSETLFQMLKKDVQAFVNNNKTEASSNDEN